MTKNDNRVSKAYFILFCSARTCAFVAHQINSELWHAYLWVSLGTVRAYWALHCLTTKNPNVGAAQKLQITLCFGSYGSNMPLALAVLWSTRETTNLIMPKNRVTVVIVRQCTSALTSAMQEKIARPMLGP